MLNLALQEIPPYEISRRDTTLAKYQYLSQLPLGAPIGTQRWVRHALEIRVAESTADRHLVAEIVKKRHYLGKWPVRPKTKILSYIGTMAGVPAADAAASAMFALMPGQYHAARALEIHPCSVLTLVRLWRADDMGPDISPGLTPTFLRRIVSGHTRKAFSGLGETWDRAKVDGVVLRAPAKLLCTYADPAMGHDGATYVAAGAVDCGMAKSGKKLFAWGLVPEIQEDLKRYAAARIERDQENEE